MVLRQWYRQRTNFALRTSAPCSVKPLEAAWRFFRQIPILWCHGNQCWGQEHFCPWPQKVKLQAIKELTKEVLEIEKLRQKNKSDIEQMICFLEESRVDEQLEKIAECPLSELYNSRIIPGNWYWSDVRYCWHQTVSVCLFTHCKAPWRWRLWT